MAIKNPRVLFSLKMATSNSNEVPFSIEICMACCSLSQSATGYFCCRSIVVGGISAGSKPAIVNISGDHFTSLVSRLNSQLPTLAMRCASYNIAWVRCKSLVRCFTFNSNFSFSCFISASFCFLSVISCDMPIIIIGSSCSFHSTKACTLIHLILPSRKKIR